MSDSIGIVHPSRTQNSLCFDTVTDIREAGENIAFMKNLGAFQPPGGEKCAGEWSICGGSSQSFSDATVSPSTSKTHLRA